MSEHRHEPDAQYRIVRSDSDGQMQQPVQQPSSSLPTAHIQAPLYHMQQRQQAHVHTASYCSDTSRVSNAAPPSHSRTPSSSSIVRGAYTPSNRSRANSSSSQGHPHRQPPIRYGHSRTPSSNPQQHSRPPPPNQPHARTRTYTGASSDGSVTSESEFIAYRDIIEIGNNGTSSNTAANNEPRPVIAGYQYGPYAYLNNPHNMAAERHYSQESLSMRRGGSISGSGSGSRSGSSHGHSYSHPMYAQQSAQAGMAGGSAPMMHVFGSTSTSSFGSYGSQQQGQLPYMHSSGRPMGTHSNSRNASTVGHDSIEVITQANYTANHASETHFLYDPNNPEKDDYMHNPASPAHGGGGGGAAQHDAIMERRTCSVVSIRGFCNVIALVLIMLALIGLFGAYPIIQEIYVRQMSYMGSFGLGGTNATGQVPEIPNLPGLIDTHTPEAAYKRTGFDGHAYNLVFSDEFEVDGRTFYPGDDPYWEAVDLHYWGTGDYEWNDPEAITTKDGHLEITMTKQPTHGLDYQGGMLQSWNKLCFTGGFLEVSVSLPGTPSVSGFWPGVWTMGNLARAGYGATTEGMWPYSYDSCDVGTLKNQTMNDQPAAAANGLSFQPGQRVSGCTCKGEDHPGPNPRKGRGAPEIDIIEAQNSNAHGRMQGEVSQSAQIAPYDDGYHWKQASPASMIYNPDITSYNSYIGGPLQEAVSGITLLEDEGYEVNGGFRTYGVEYKPGGGDDAFITWMYNDKPTWKVTAATFPADPVTQVSQRLISEEPMSMIINLHMSDSFQFVDLANLQFPSKLRIDYVRIYQREGEVNLSCDPKEYPTAKYISDHLNAYSNPNLTTWAEAGYQFPKNRLVDAC